MIHIRPTLASPHPRKGIPLRDAVTALIAPAVAASEIAAAASFYKMSTALALNLLDATLAAQVDGTRRLLRVTDERTRAHLAVIIGEFRRLCVRGAIVLDGYRWDKPNGALPPLASLPFERIEAGKLQTADLVFRDDEVWIGEVVYLAVYAMRSKELARKRSGPPTDMHEIMALHARRFAAGTAESETKPEAHDLFAETYGRKATDEDDLKKIENIRFHVRKAKRARRAESAKSV